MLTVYIADPEEIIEKHTNAIGIACDKCSLEYSIEDYQILKDNNKLLYFWGSVDETEKESRSFHAESLIMCHSCFFKQLKNACGDDKVMLKVVGATEETVIEFTPSEIIEDFDDEDSDDSYLGLF